MKHSDVATHRRRKVASVLVLAVVGAVACGRERQQQPSLTQDEVAFLDDSAAANAACNPPANANTRAGFVGWASTLRYRKIHGRWAMNDFTRPSPTDSAYVEITSPRRGPRELAEGCVIGRIVSTYRDSAFGFIAGRTYIWADSSSPNSIHLVPDDGTSEMIGYNLATEPYVEDTDPTISAGTPSKHICEQCGRSDWCVYPRDTLRTIEPNPPDITISP